MAEIAEICVFMVLADNIKFATKTNGDTITITGLDLEQEQAASLAWLVNHPGNLIIKVKPEPVT